MSKNLFITGTGTDVGKTYITGLIIRKLNEINGDNLGEKSGGNSSEKPTKPVRKNAYFKAAMSGNNRGADGKIVAGDAEYVKRVSGITQPIEEMCPYVYEAAVSPHLAARSEGAAVELGVIKRGFERACSEYTHVTMEGSGGIICPLRYDGEVIMLEDVIRELKLGCVIVASAALGTINSVVLTVAYMRVKKIEIKGIIYNRVDRRSAMELDNIAMCEQLTGVQTIACVEEGATDLGVSLERVLELYE